MKILRSIIDWDLWQKLKVKDYSINTEYMFKKEKNQMKTIEVCVGVGLNQLFPEYVTIEIPQEKKPRKKTTPKPEKEVSVDSQKVVKPRKKSKGDTK